MVGTILIVILILALVGALPRWSHSRSWGYAPTGGVGLQLLLPKRLHGRRHPFSRAGPGHRRELLWDNVRRRGQQLLHRFWHWPRDGVQTYCPDAGTHDHQHLAHERHSGRGGVHLDSAGSK
jgi:uncharacterized protein DUF3309